MRKKIALLLVTILAVFSLAGCTNEQKGLYDSFKAVSTWKASEVKEKGEVVVEVQGEKATVGFDLTAYSNVEDMSFAMNMNLDIKSKDFNAKISGIELYMVNYQMYINKATIINVCNAIGEEVPKEIQMLDGDYISVADLGKDMGESYAILGLDEKNPTQAILKFYESIAKDLGINILVTKEGNVYTVALNGEQLFDIFIQGIEKGVENLDKLNETLSLGLTPEQIAEAKEGYAKEKDQMLQDMTAIKPMMKDMNLKCTFESKDKEYNQTIAVDMKIPELMNFTAKFDTNSKQVEPKEVKIPGKVATMTMDELTALMTPKSIMLDIESEELYGANGETIKAKVIEKEGVVYVPLKSVMKSFGEEVVYNSKTKQAGIKQDGKITDVKGFVKGSTTYVSLEEIEKLGFKTEYSEEYKFITIEK